MKETGYEVVGYTRKSKGEKDDIIRIRLLNLMLEKLKTRSLADKVFVSPNSSADDSFNQRDEKKPVEMMSYLIANGDTQDMLKYISDKEKKIILVAIDYAGLTINCEDLKSFLSSVKEIVIDQILSKNKVRMYTSGELLNNEEKLKEFDCRKNCLQRSK
ncbi:hypothetical protein EDC94DRAFT_633994 [Helicostylum pulchrum]|nr:hypothetical protein EDC94DRAFT_633994 [Helicostylum pulchrum]